jgi:uridine kinase
METNRCFLGRTPAPQKQRQHQHIHPVQEEGVPQDKVYLLCLIAAPQGIHAVCKRFPALRVVVSEIDMGIDEHSLVVPGVGEFGNRYFST